MKTIKKQTTIFWITTGVIFLFEGVLTAFTANTEMAKASFISLGYPEYFGTMLNVFKVLGALALIIPKVPNRIKEWAYVGFGIDFIAAVISKLVVDKGFTIDLLFPIIAFAILAMSYISFHKIIVLKSSNTNS